MSRNIFFNTCVWTCVFFFQTSVGHQKWHFDRQSFIYRQQPIFLENYVDISIRMFFYISVCECFSNDTETLLGLVNTVMIFWGQQWKLITSSFPAWLCATAIRELLVSFCPLFDKLFRVSFQGFLLLKKQSLFALMSVTFCIPDPGEHQTLSLMIPQSLCIPDSEKKKSLKFQPISVSMTMIRRDRKSVV